MTSYSKIPINDNHRFWLKVIYDLIKYVSDIWNWEQTFFDDVYDKCVLEFHKEI